MADNEKRYPQSKAEPEEKELLSPVTMMVYAGPEQMANGGKLYESPLCAGRSG